MSLNVLLTSLGAVPAALLVKQLQFGRLLIIGVIASLTSGTVALVLALQDRGVWALAIQSLLLAAMSAVGAWLAVPQRPSFAWSADSARRLLGTGRFVLAANMCDVAYARIVVLLVGTIFGPARLGYYLRADSTQQMPADAASAVLGRVALPVFSEASDDTEGLRVGLRLSIRTATTVIAPTLALAGALSGPLVQTLYGSQWRPSAPLLTILCLGGLLWPLHVMNIQLMYALGEARTVFRLDLVKKGVGLVAIGCGSLFGLHGVAWAAVMVGLFASAVNGRVAGRELGLGTVEQLRSVGTVIALAVGVAVCAGAASQWWTGHTWVELVVLGLAGFAAYLGLARLLRVSAVLETMTLLRQVKERDRAW
jgi:O-antigen/teichoic acid export membrane protein